MEKHTDTAAPADDLSPENLAKFQRLATDFPYYAERCLKIRTKRGETVPFVLNRVQRHIHEKLEQQLAATGRVRALILKGRQEGCSTYVEGRFYWRATHRRGVQAFILTHEMDATNNLFKMANRFHEHCPEAMRPHTGAANAKELRFDRLDSGYRVATTGGDGDGGAGRSQTNQLFHGSEVSRWKNASDQAAGAIQTVPDDPETEIILESTARGFGNYFHRMWSDAERGLSVYIAIFIPWFWAPEYQAVVPDGFVLSPEDVAYQGAHKLTVQQMAWRANKVRELAGDEILFRQEYPATAAEAFQTTDHESYISAELVLKARKADCMESGSLVIGADPARGGDRFSVAWRRGRKVLKVESRKIKTIPEGVGWLKSIIDRDTPARMFIDVGGLGVGTCDMLAGYGAPYSAIVKAVNFASKPFEPPSQVDEEGNPLGGPLNRRAEMWQKSKEWLTAEGGADVPDSDTLQADACAPGYTWDTQNRLKLESKEAIKARGGASPDEWDAIALTFAEPVAAPKVKRALHERSPGPSSPTGDLAWMGT